MAKASIRFCLLLSLLLSVPASADILDTAISVVAPELKPARPVLQCAISGKSIQGCATDAGKGELAKDQRVQDVLEVYGYAQAGNYPKLISKLGVTVACTAFEVPGKELACNEFSRVLVDAGSQAVSATASVAARVVGAVIGTAEDIACGVGIYCSKSDNTVRFDVGVIWSRCYAPRVGEGIRARLTDVGAYQRMLAVPAAGGWGDAQALGANCINDYLRALDNTPEIMRDEFKQQFLSGYRPVAIGLSEQFRRIVEPAAAAALEDADTAFDRSSAAWTLRAITMPLSFFDSADYPSAMGVANEQCKSKVELPAAGLIRWAQSAASLQDQSQVDGQPASVHLQKQGWCKRTFLPVMTAILRERRGPYMAAMTHGCHAISPRGLSCPTAGDGIAQCRQAYQNLGDGLCRAETVSAGEQVQRIGAPKARLPGTAPPASLPRIGRPKPAGQ